MGTPRNGHHGNIHSTHVSSSFMEEEPFNLLSDLHQRKQLNGVQHDYMSMSPRSAGNVAEGRYPSRSRSRSSTPLRKQRVAIEGRDDYSTASREPSPSPHRTPRNSTARWSRKESGGDERRSQQQGSDNMSVSSAPSVNNRSQSPVMLSESQMIEARESALRILNEARHESAQLQPRQRKEQQKSPLTKLDTSILLKHDRHAEAAGEISNYTPPPRSPSVSFSPSPRSKSSAVSSTDEATVVRRRNATLLEENSNLKVKLAAAESRAEKEAMNVKEITSKVNESQHTIQDLEAKIHALEEKGNEKEKLKKQVKEHIDALEKDQELAKKMFEEKLKAKDTTMKELEVSLGKKDKTITSLQFEIAQMKSSMKETRTHIDKEVSRVREEEKRKSEEAVISIEKAKQEVKNKLTAQLDDSKASIEKLEKMVESQKRSIEEKEAQNISILKEKDQMREGLAAKEDKICDYKSSLKELERDSEHLSVSLRHKEEMVVNLTKQLESLQSSKDFVERDFDMKLNEKNEEIKDLTSELHAQKQAEESIRIRLDRQSLDYEDEKRHIEEELRTTLRCVDEQRKDHQKLIEEIKRQEMINSSLKKDFSKLRAGLQDKERLLEDSDAAVKRMKKENAHIVEKFELAEVTYEKAMKEKNDLEAKLEKFLLSRDEDINEIEMMLRESEANVTCLKREVVRVEEEKDKAERELESEQQTNSALRSEMREFAAKTEETVASLRKEKEKHQLESQAASRQVLQQEKDIQTILRDMESVQSSNNTLTQKLKKVEGELHHSHDTIGRLERSLASEKQSMSALRSEMRQFAKNMEETETQYKNDIRELETSNSALRGEVTCMKEQLCEAEDKAALVPDLEEMLRRTESDLKHLKDDFTSLQRESNSSINDLRQQISDLEQENKGLNININNRREEVEENEALLRQMERELHRHQEEMSTLERDLSSEKQTLSLLRAELRDMAAKMEGSDEKHQQDKELLQNEAMERSKQIDEQDRYIQRLLEDLDICKADRAELNDHVLAMEKELSIAEQNLQDAQRQASDALFRKAELEKELKENNDLLDRVKYRFTS